MTAKLNAALTLARQGFKVFPIKEGAKHPPLVANWPQLATSDERLIAAQWGPTGTPEANIGISGEGMAVVDVDPKKGGDVSYEALEQILGWPATLRVMTPSGGWHCFYKLPAGHPGVPNSVEELGKGLDVRSTNGYVVGRGSTTAAGEYVIGFDGPVVPAPDWLVQKLGVSTKREQPIQTNIPDAPDASVERAREWLATAERSVKGQGGDQAAFRVACKLRDLGMSYEQACELMRSEAWDYGCGWREGRLEDKPIRSAYTYAQNEAGGGRGVVEDDLPLPAQESAAPQRKSLPRSRVLRADAYAAEAGTGPGYVVKNLLNRSSYAVGFGSPGAGKTFVFLDIGYHVANGRPWMGLNVRGGPVLYLAYEGVGGLKKRAKALQQKYGTDLGPLYIVSATMNLREQAGRQELGSILAEMPEKPALVIVDTFARALMGGDENSAQDVGAFNDAIAKLIDHTGACVLLIHHSGKNKAAGARGSSAILGAIDTELEIEALALRPSKQRDLELLPAIPFKLRPTVVGVDSDGEEEKSCVVEPGSAVHASKPLTGKGEHAFSILSEMTGPENAPVPRSRWVAKLQDEGFGRSSAHEWVRRLVRYGKATLEEDMVSRRMT